MKFLKALSLLTVATLGKSTTGEKDDMKQQEESGNGGNLRNSNENRALAEVFAIPTESRIVGGSDAPDDAYPFFVSWGGCGASLVADNVILSAAHCAGQSLDDVIVGQSRKGGNPNGVSRKIIQRISHPDYGGFAIDNDYMVMKLDDPVDTNLYPPIGLNSQSSIPAEGEELTVIGFGALSQGGSMTPSQLQEVDVNYILSRTCNRGFWSYNGSVKDATMFCAGTGGGKDSCQGDSGGPIFTKREPFEQVGIVSWGRGCAQRRYPGVYSRISGEFDWIKSQVCEFANTPPPYCSSDYVAPEPGPTPEPEPGTSEDDDDSMPNLVQQFFCTFFPRLDFCN